ncbi:MAG: hypothetical protein NDJ92_06095 [Thermoanaerobaculia bacterium]|nr:hypothetical protein [Thermoanaerobaculia bacterium]
MTNGNTARRAPASFLRHCRSPRNLPRAATTSAIVGPLLTIINQTAIVASFVALERVPAAALVRIALTFAVPFGVSLVSSALADRARDSA